MDQQQLFTPISGDQGFAGDNVDGPDPRRGPASTVVSEGEWLAVSTEGFSEQQRGRPLEHLIKELVQNALDAVGGSGRIDLDLEPTSLRTATVRCADDGPGAEDLSRLNVVFVTGKKDGVTQRGRMGRGFKELLSIATRATVRSRDGELAFTLGADGTRRVTHGRGLDWHPGFEAVMEIEHDEAGKELAGYFHSFLLPAGVVLTVNGTQIPARSTHKVLEAKLTTERFTNGRWEKPGLVTRIHLVATAAGETPLIYEMGIPVCGVEWSEPYHCDVQQRVPMNPNRDAVMSGYPARLHRACLPMLLEEMTTERALAAWVGEAAQSASDQVQKAVVDKAFGSRIVRAVPVAGRFDHNADAEDLGATIIHTAHMPGGFRKLLQQQVPTSAHVSKQAQQRRAEAATEAALTRADVIALDLPAYDPDATLCSDVLNATQAIALYGWDVVLARMDFAQWFAEAIMQHRHGQPRTVPVRVAFIEDADATWSFTGVLTLSLATVQHWCGPLTSACFELLLHEIAHQEAFHHGRSFPKEVEAYAGAAVAVMLTRTGEVRRKFPNLVPPMPENWGLLVKRA